MCSRQALLAAEMIQGTDPAAVQTIAVLNPLMLQAVVVQLSCMAYEFVLLQRCNVAHMRMFSVFLALPSATVSSCCCDCLDGVSQELPCYVRPAMTLMPARYGFWSWAVNHLLCVVRRYGSWCGNP